jgi:iron uptake system component EfeO
MTVLPTFVIGLREGLEAALIVGIIAAFLRQQGRADLMRWVFAGIATAVGLCLAVGAVLEALSHDLPQRQQEGLETVIGVLAVGMVTYMVVWMRRHSRELKGALEGSAAAALARGGTGRTAAQAMVVMAFLAVLREGIETVVFLFATFNESGNTASAGTGALLGIAVAVALGWGIYRGGVRLNLSRFFRVTGLVLVLVAAGLVVTALHTAHEAGWLDAGQQRTVDLSGLVRAGSVQASLLTGMLGIQPYPVVIELVAWLAYLVPVGLYVAWPPNLPLRDRRIAAWLAGSAVAVAGSGALVVATASPAPGDDPTTIANAASNRITAGDASAAVSRIVNVTVTAASGCQLSATTLPAGPLTFRVTNKDATAVSEVELDDGDRIMGEKENLPPGFSGSFAVNVDAGHYSLYCPGAPTERTDVTVTGKSATPTSGDDTTKLLTVGAREYARYVATQVSGLVGSAKTLSTALATGDLATAQRAYDRARPFYEKIEPVAESFTLGTNNLDADIDARAGDVPAAQWRGFHRIEKGLFADHSTKGLAPYGRRLVTDVEKLQRLTKGLAYRPFELANGAQELLDEVASSKITGEEERYSHIDLLDVEGNDEGAEQAFADLEPGLTRIDPALSRSIAARFRALDRLVDTYRTGDNPAGFVTYTSLTNADKRQLAAAVKAVQEPLSRVASTVAGS